MSTATLAVNKIFCMIIMKEIHTVITEYFFAKKLVTRHIST